MAMSNPNPISVTGIDHLTKNLIDSMLDGGRRANKQAKSKNTSISLSMTGGLEIKGQFAFDKSGRLGITGRVYAANPLPVNTGAEVEGGLDKEWTSLGIGESRLYIEVSLNITEIGE